MLYGDGGPYYICGPRIHEFLQEMHREVFAGRDRTLLTVGEMPGRHRGGRRPVHRSRAGREVDMVFQFEHVALDQEDGNKWRPKKLCSPTSRSTLGRWQEGLAERGWNSLYWGNHDQARAVSRFGDDGQYRELSAKMLAGVLHLHRGTPYVYQGEELGMTNMTFGAISDYRDIEVLNHHREATTHLGHTDAEVLAALAPLNRDNARTPVQWDASPACRLHHRGALDRGEPERQPHQRRRPGGRPGLGLQLLPQGDRAAARGSVVSYGDFSMLLPDDEHVYAFKRSLPDARTAGAGQLFGRPEAGSTTPALTAPGQTPELVLGNYPPKPATQPSSCARGR